MLWLLKHTPNSDVTRRYIDTSNFDKTQIITDAKEALSRHEMEFGVREQLQSLIPDNLYREYQNFIPLLSGDAQDWYFHLDAIFLTALPVELKISFFPKDISCIAWMN